MHVVVVESPAKARTLGSWLGIDYTVIASYGHVSDLPAKDGSVLPERDFQMVYRTAPRAGRIMGTIRTALAGAESLVLATDPDREGEAIAWQVLTWLRERDAIGDRPVRRVTFHEITPDAVRDALMQPRAIDMALVHAQQARRALDYLVGFHLSPVLWRKIPGSRSAGRVQSVALRLICEREAAIEDFMPREYWTVEAEVEAAGGAFAARLSHLDGNALGPLSLETATMAERAVERIRGGFFHVAALDRSEVRRDPPPPFTTAALQQDASRRLGIGVDQVMRIAQALYEGVTFGGETTGLITYMRTDSVALSEAAVAGARDAVRDGFGEAYLPARPRRFPSAASPGRSRRRRAGTRAGRGRSARTRRAASPSRSGAAASGSTCKGAGAWRNPARRRCRCPRQWRPRRSPRTSPAPSWRCRARSAGIPTAASRSWPGSGATGPGSGTAGPMHRSRRTRTC